MIALAKRFAKRWPDAELFEAAKAASEQDFNVKSGRISFIDVGEEGAGA
jgi:hypothetical protein